MWKLAAFLIACAIVWGEDDPWQKVKDLKTGSDIRVYKKGSAKPIVTKFGGVRREALVVIVRNEETAITKVEIDRVEYRPPRSAVKTESSTTTVDANGQNSSWSSDTSWSRDGWQVLYQRK